MFVLADLIPRKAPDAFASGAAMVVARTADREYRSEEHCLRLKARMLRLRQYRSDNGREKQAKAFAPIKGRRLPGHTAAHLVYSPGFPPSQWSVPLGVTFAG